MEWNWTWRLISLLLHDGGGDVKLWVSCCEIEVVS
jgi:hypothetical protein